MSAEQLDPKQIANIYAEQLGMVFDETPIEDRKEFLPKLEPGSPENPSPLNLLVYPTEARMIAKELGDQNLEVLSKAYLVATFAALRDEAIVTSYQPEGVSEEEAEAFQRTADALIEQFLQEYDEGSEHADVTEERLHQLFDDRSAEKVGIEMRLARLESERYHQNRIGEFLSEEERANLQALASKILEKYLESKRQEL